jgi:hypothetical protein
MIPRDEVRHLELRVRREDCAGLLQFDVRLEHRWHVKLRDAGDECDQVVTVLMENFQRGYRDVTPEQSKFGGADLELALGGELRDSKLRLECGEPGSLRHWPCGLWRGGWPFNRQESGRRS